MDPGRPLTLTVLLAYLKARAASPSLIWAAVPTVGSNGSVFDT